MDGKLHRRIQRYGWDLAVEDYARYWVPVLTECSTRTVALLDLRPGERVIDIATGTGVAALLAAERVGERGSVAGTDLAAKMVDKARAAPERRRLTNVTFERMDAGELSFDDASFDAAACVLGLMYPADPQRAIDEMARVLRPGGRAAVCAWGRRDRCGWNAVFPITDARVNSDVCPLFFSLGAPDALRLAFERAGFVDLHEERVDMTLHWASDEDACAAMFAGGPVALAYSRFDDATRTAVHAEYLESIAPFRKNGAYEVPGEFVYMRGATP